MNISEDKLSMREAGKLKRWLGDEEKEERRKNFVIKGISTEAYNELKGKDINDVKEWVKMFLKNKMDIDCNLEYCRWSTKVIIGKVGSSEEKKAIMSIMKYKLKGFGNVYLLKMILRGMKERYKKK